MSKAVTNGDWNRARSAADNARHVLPGLVGCFFEAGRATLIQADVPARTLHSFRLEVKRFRYTLELFLPVYGPALGARVEQLRQLQRALGGLNDVSNLESLLAKEREVAGADFPKVTRRLQSQKTKLRKELAQAWQALDAPGAEAAWRRYLARPRRG